jgi:hypothetical protein
MSNSAKITTVKVTKGNNGKFSAEIVKNNAIPASAEPEVEKKVEEVVQEVVAEQPAASEPAANAQPAVQGGRRRRAGSCKKRNVVSLRKRRNSKRNARKSKRNVRKSKRNARRRSHRSRR